MACSDETGDWNRANLWHDRPELHGVARPAIQAVKMCEYFHILDELGYNLPDPVSELMKYLFNLTLLFELKRNHFVVQVHGFGRLDEDRLPRPTRTVN